MKAEPSGGREEEEELQHHGSSDNAALLQICPAIFQPALVSCVGGSETQKMLTSDVSSAAASFRRR